MKKVFIVCAVLLLALPSIGLAGSATSRWDMTLGGYVKFDVVYADKAVGVNNTFSPRDSRGNVDVAEDSTSNLTWGDAETRLNWLMRGPDALGAKTSAFVEGEFVGRGNTETGLFQLRHAYMQMVWPKTTLIIGQTWQAWGFTGTLNILSYLENHYNKGIRPPQIRVTRSFNKNFSGTFAVQAPYNSLTAGGNVGIQQSANSLIPDLVTEFVFASDALGKIGPYNLKLAFGGFWGQDKYLVNDAASGVHFTDKKIDRYGVEFWWHVPIISEKKGSKAGALAFTGGILGGKGMGNYLAGYNVPAYDRSHGNATVVSGATTSIPDANPAYATFMAGWVQSTYYLTDKLFATAVYGSQTNNLSDAYVNTASTTTGVLRRYQNFIFNIMYDINAAIRVGAEYTHVTNAYANRATATAASMGSFSTIRLGAYYFF